VVTGDGIDDLVHLRHLRADRVRELLLPVAQVVLPLLDAIEEVLGGAGVLADRALKENHFFPAGEALGTCPSFHDEAEVVLVQPEAPALAGDVVVGHQGDDEPLDDLHAVQGVFVAIHGSESIAVG